MTATHDSACLVHQQGAMRCVMHQQGGMRCLMHHVSCINKAPSEGCRAYIRAYPTKKQTPLFANTSLCKHRDLHAYRHHGGERRRTGIEQPSLQLLVLVGSSDAASSSCCLGAPVYQLMTLAAEGIVPIPASCQTLAWSAMTRLCLCNKAVSLQR